MTDKAPKIEEYMDSDPASFAVWMMTQCDFGPPLTDEGWDDFTKTLEAACRAKNQSMGKLFVQVFTKEPDTDTAEPAERPWTGLEFDYVFTGDKTEIVLFNRFYDRDDVLDPVYDEGLNGHVQVTIPFEALDLDCSEGYLEDIPTISGSPPAA